MGRFVNPDNSAFQVALNSKIYVDKTGLIEYTNSVLDTTDAYICNSRPRRFGKSYAANMNHIILIEMLPEICFLTNLQSRKHLLRIRTLTVVCCQHIRCIRLSESAWSAITNISICRIKNTVRVLNQTSLIHIYLRIQRNLKCTIIRVYESTLVFLSPFCFF